VLVAAVATLDHSAAGERVSVEIDPAGIVNLE
jgi:hypothetical protein